MSAEFQLQAAIVALFEADDAMLALLGGKGRILDFAPENQPMPFIEFGEHNTDEFDTTPTETSEGYGREHRILLRIFSDYEGKKEAADIIERATQLLRDQPLTLTGYSNATIRYVNSSIAREPDGLAYMGILILRAVTEE